MKSKLIILALLLSAACTRFEPFTFVQMSDTQIGFFDESPAFWYSDSLMKLAVNAVNELQPAYVFITGDLIDNLADPVQDSVFTVNLKAIEAPAYTIPGNHDYRSAGQLEDYITLRGYSNFSFKDKGCAFIGIDSNIIKDGTEEMEDEQWAWLEGELAGAKGCKYIFVFMHCPVIRESIDEVEDYFNFPVDKREKYIGLFSKYGVDIAFAGHCHQEFDTVCDGVRFITAGPVCKAIGHGYPGYNVIKVGKDGLEVTYTASR